MANRSYKGAKRRTQLEKQKKREEKALRKKEQKENPTEPDPNAYLEYLNPAGMIDEEAAEDDTPDEDGESDS